MHDHSDHLFSRHFLWLKFASALYVVGLIVAHSQLPDLYIWEIAVFFSIAMNFTYPAVALKTGRYVVLELAISLVLIGLSLASLISLPYFVILAIFLHGAWDLKKHSGMGVGFFTWYVLGCVSVDWFYSICLLIYALNI